MSAERWYLAGPMHGIPQFNIPAFDATAAKLRAAGYDIVSPAELDDPGYRAACLNSMGNQLPDAKTTWGDLLARDVKLIADEVTGIILLPGWTKSRGARLEVMVGLLTGKVFCEWLAGVAKPVAHAYIRTDLQRNLP